MYQYSTHTWQITSTGSMTAVIDVMHSLEDAIARVEEKESLALTSGDAVRGGGTVWEVSEGEDSFIVHHKTYETELFEDPRWGRTSAQGVRRR